MDEDFTIIQDTREQLGWSPYFKSPCVVKTLSTGDYSVLGLEDQISIERKSLDDMTGCLTKGRDRFTRELERSQDLEFFRVIIEAPFSDLALGNYISKMSPVAAMESLATWEVRYHTAFLFCGSQKLSAMKCESLLKKFHRERQKTVITEDYDFPF